MWFRVLLQIHIKANFYLNIQACSDKAGPTCAYCCLHQCLGAKEGCGERSVEQEGSNESVCASRGVTPAFQSCPHLMRIFVFAAFVVCLRMTLLCEWCEYTGVNFALYIQRDRENTNSQNAFRLWCF